MTMWPFGSKHKKPSRHREIEQLTSAVSNERTELYRNLVKLDNATKAIDGQGVRSMLDDMFHRLDESKHRG